MPEVYEDPKAGTRITQKRTLFRYPGDPKVRAIVMGDARERVRRDGRVYVMFTAPGLQNVGFWWLLDDLLYKYVYEVEETSVRGRVWLETGYVYAPYIPLQQG